MVRTTPKRACAGWPVSCPAGELLALVSPPAFHCLTHLSVPLSSGQRNRRDLIWAHAQSGDRRSARGAAVCRRINCSVHCNAGAGRAHFQCKDSAGRARKPCRRCYDLCARKSRSQRAWDHVRNSRFQPVFRGPFRSRRRPMSGIVVHRQWRVLARHGELNAGSRRQRGKEGKIKDAALHGMQPLASLWILPCRMVGSRAANGGFPRLFNALFGTMMIFKPHKVYDERVRQWVHHSPRQG